MSCKVKKNYDLNEIKFRCINDIPDHINCIISLGLSVIEKEATKFNVIHSLIKEQKLFATFVEDVKDDGASDRFRQQGNKRFKKGKFKEAHELYTKSIASAIPGSEYVALAYGNRSAVLYETKYYEECLEDIERALSNKYPEKFKAKLVERRENATKFNQNSKRIRPYEEPPEFPNDSNKQIKDASDAIKIIKTKKYGRHIVAVRELNVGEIVAKEIPKVGVIVSQKYLTCHYCLKPCLNLLPCNECTQELYCSLNCRETAAKEYHDIECKILATMKELDFDEEVRLALRMILKVRDDLEKFKPHSNELYDDSVQGIFQLETHHDERDNSETFNRIIEAAIIYDLLDKYTDLFKSSLKGKLDVFKEQLLHLMEVVVINKGRVSVLAENKKADIYDDVIVGYDLSCLCGLLNHECNPNVLVISHGPTKVIRVVQTIKPGEQLAINYCGHYASTSIIHRQLTLKEKYFFNCTCVPCKNYWPIAIRLSTKKLRLHLDLNRIRTPNIEEAQAVLDKWLPKVKEIEAEAPSLSSFNIQEIIKQCYTIFGNKLITF